MKVNDSFNAGATKKKTNPLEAAIQGNFNPRPTQPSATINARATEPAPRPASVLVTETPQPKAPEAAPVSQPAAVTQPVTQAPVQETKPAAAETAEASKSAEKKNGTPREKKDSFLVYMSKGERSIFKSYCALQNVSMNHFVICAMDYFKEEMEKGKVVITKHGYKRQ